jgi:signal transduction histidine kinase
MSTEAIALPHRRWLSFDRIRGLYSGFGYVLAVSLVMVCWWSLQWTVPELLRGNLRDQSLLWWLQFVGAQILAIAPGPLLVPPVINLAPRSGWMRLPFLLAAALPMAWWCLGYAGEIHFGWDLQTLGFVFDGLIETSLVVGVCAYHSYSREAQDSLLRGRIERTSLSAELQRAQLRLLHAQIEPHFLFNTLSVVQALSRQDRAATVVMLDNLTRYFAAALPRLKDDEVPLAQELELVEAYLSIYRVRMGARLGYEISLPPELAQVRVPSMAVLTLVENALKHGVSQNVEGGFIRVSAAAEERSLRLVVADSGRGLGARQGQGVGLANIGQRLRMMYGAEATLSLRSAEPRGVVATIRLPLT